MAERGLVAGIDVVRGLRAQDPEAVVMVVTAFGTIETAVEAMKEGAFDFIAKPFSPKTLWSRLDEVINRPRPFSQVKSLLRPVPRLLAAGKAN